MKKNETISKILIEKQNKIESLIRRGLNQNEIALKLGISRQLLQYNLKKMNLTRKQREKKKDNSFIDQLRKSIDNL